jgi:hypothetical protein
LEGRSRSPLGSSGDRDLADSGRRNGRREGGADEHDESRMAGSRLRTRALARRPDRRAFARGRQLASARSPRPPAAEVKRHQHNENEGGESPTVVDGWQQGNQDRRSQSGLHGGSREASQCHHIGFARNAL